MSTLQLKPATDEPRSWLAGLLASGAGNAKKLVKHFPEIWLQNSKGEK